MLNIFRKFRKEEDNEVVVAEVVSVIDKDGNEIVIDNEEVEETIDNEVEEEVIDNNEEEIAMDNDEEVEEENNEKETIKERIEKQFKTYKEKLMPKFNKFKITMKKLGVLCMMGILVVLYRIERIFKKVETVVSEHVKKVEEKVDELLKKYENE